MYGRAASVTCIAGVPACVRPCIFKCHSTNVTQHKRQ